MPTYISKATGNNFTNIASWAPISAVSLAELDSEGGSTTVPQTTPTFSATFTPLAVAHDGIAIKIATRPGSTGTITVIFKNNTSAGVREGSLTINVSNLDSSGLGWAFFKFSGGVVTPNGTDVYKVGISTSSATQVTCYTDGTASNWSRMVRLTSAASTPTTADKLMIMGEWTAADAQTAFTVTMDSTVATSYGPTVSGGPPQGMTISKGGTLTFATNIAAYLQIKGILGVYGGGTLNIGTSGARIGASSSAILEFGSVANVDSGLVAFPGSTVNIYGDNARLVSTLMTVDKAAATTVITLASTAGWSNTDLYAFASTSRTAADCESKTGATVDSPTQITLASGLTNAHSGTSPTQAEVVNLTRNVKIRGITSLLQGYCFFQTTSVVNIDYAEFTQLGSSTGTKRGIDVNTTTGACSLTHCSLHDSTVTLSFGFNALTSGGLLSNVTFSNNVTFNIASIHFQTATTSGTWTADSNVFLRCTDSSVNLVNLGDVGGTFTNNTMVGSSNNGLSLNEANVIGTCSGNVCHSNANLGCILAVGGTSGTIDTLSAWRNSAAGLSIPNPVYITVSSATLFGNLTRNLLLATPAGCLFTNLVSSGDTTFATASGVELQVNNADTDIVFESSTFGVVSGIKTAHTQDILCNAAVYATLSLRNCLLASTTEVGSQSNLLPGSYIRSQKHDQTVGNHKTWTKYGTISVDTTLFDVASPSARLTPSDASNKLALDGGSVDQKGALRVPVASGNTVTVTVKVRKSVVGDGTAYNGTAPRLILRKNVAAGITTDTVLATDGGTGSTSTTWGTGGTAELLTGVSTPAVTDDCVLSFVVDCDGTTGWVNADSWTVVGGAPSLGMQFWSEGLPFATPGPSAVVPTELFGVESVQIGA